MPGFPQPPIAIDEVGRFEVRLAQRTYDVVLEISGGGVLGTVKVDDGAVTELKRQIEDIEQPR